MSELKLVEESNAVYIILDGSANIQTGAEILKLFTDAIKYRKDILVNHQNVGEFDLTYLQLLKSLHISAIESGNSLRIEGTHPESFIALVKGSGFPFTFFGLNEKPMGILGGNSNE